MLDSFIERWLRIKEKTIYVNIFFFSSKVQQFFFVNFVFNSNGEMSVARDPLRIRKLWKCQSWKNQSEFLLFFCCKQLVNTLWRLLLLLLFFLS
jgi:hypothetical protein